MIIFVVTLILVVREYKPWRMILVALGLRIKLFSRAI